MSKHQRAKQAHERCQSRVLLWKRLNGKKYSRTTINHTLALHIKFHELRHTYASLLVANGVPINDISEVLGHSSKSITLDIYSHVFKNSLKRVAKKVADIYSSMPTDIG